jgi:exodeoxyribonuclease VII large subunit
MRQRGITSLFEWGEKSEQGRFTEHIVKKDKQENKNERTQKHEQQILSVSDLSTLISDLLTTQVLTDIRVRGEVRNLKKNSGHLYFSLSEHGEQEAVVSCKMWRSAVKSLAFTAEDGMAVIAYGTIQSYAPHGTYSLIVSGMESDGAGDKHLLLERWKQELSEEGIFAVSRKRTLPRYPQKIGVVTSPTGAVFHDIRNVIKNRYPLELVLSPTSVQGTDAPTEIKAAIERLLGLVDLIIVARGGGSFEDLFPFNSPEVVRAIFAAPVPVIAAIGHEVDVTLADLAADVRASTPSHAAELAVPDKNAEIAYLKEYRQKFHQSMRSSLDHAWESLNYVQGRFIPITLERGLMARQQQLADQTERMTHVMSMRYDIINREIVAVLAQLKAYNPAIHFSREIKQKRDILATLRSHFNAAYAKKLEMQRIELHHMLDLIKANNPHLLCAKGYCFATNVQGSIIRSIHDIEIGSEITMALVDGSATATVHTINDNRHEEKHGR